MPDRACNQWGMLKRLKRIKAVKPPKDFNEFGRYFVDLTTASDPPKVTKDEVSRVMANLGARGGKIGGKRRDGDDDARAT